ncbi:hypothetical protein FJC99_25950, partial [Escherichia coli]|nr:hypothetical protein [Escherichia coli]
MSDVQSHVKPLTLTTGRGFFAIAGCSVPQSLVSDPAMHFLPGLVCAAAGLRALSGATTLLL